MSIKIPKSSYRYDVRIKRSSNTNNRLLNNKVLDIMKSEDGRAICGGVFDNNGILLKDAPRRIIEELKKLEVVMTYKQVYPPRTSKAKSKNLIQLA